MVLLKYLSKFWRTLEMPLIDLEISPMLNWSEKFLLVAFVLVTLFRVGVFFIRSLPYGS